MQRTWKTSCLLTHDSQGMLQGIIPNFSGRKRSAENGTLRQKTFLRFPVGKNQKQLTNERNL